MAEKTTLARPYAQAIFALAQETSNYAAWGAALAELEAVIDTAPVQRLLGNPRVSRQQLIDILVSACGDGTTTQTRRLIEILAANDRLVVVPQIAQLYGEYRAAAERVIEAKVTSAFTVTAEQQEAIKTALKARLGRDVALSCEVDKSLIGGAIIRAGDLVIDGSITGKLNKLNLALSH